MTTRFQGFSPARATGHPHDLDHPARGGQGEPAVMTAASTPVTKETTSRWSVSGTRGVGRSDGAWWPRSTDLATEIVDLDVAVHGLLHERIARVWYPRGMWPDAPREVHTSLGTTKVGWGAHARYPDTIDLFLSGDTHLVLTVIPSGTDSAFAGRVLADYGA